MRIKTGSWIWCTAIGMDSPLFLRQDDGTRVDSAPPGDERNKIRTVIADFDNDGAEEIMWNNIGEPNRLFRRQDTAWIAADIGDALEPNGLGTGAAVVDLDEDGVLELIIAHGESRAQPLTVYRWGDTNHFLEDCSVDPPGGRREVLKWWSMADGLEHRRIIDSGRIPGQMEPVVHIGLGQSQDVRHVDVVWPNGVQLRIDSPRVDRKIIVEYPRGEGGQNEARPRRSLG